MARSLSEEELQLRRRARRRLIGAVVLTTAVVVLLPMVLDSEPRPIGEDIAVQIPSPGAGPYAPRMSTKGGEVGASTGASSPAGVSASAPSVAADTSGPASPRAGTPGRQPPEQRSSGKGSSESVASGSSSPENRASERSASENRTSEKSASENRTSEKSASENRTSEKSASEKVSPEKGRSEKDASARRALETGATASPAAPASVRGAPAAAPGDVALLEGRAAPRVEAPREPPRANPPSPTRTGAEASIAAIGEAERTDKARARPETFVIQLGAFAEVSRAKDRYAQLQKAGIRAYTEVIKTPTGDKTRVRAGPFPTREAAEQVNAKLKSLGIADGVVVTRRY